MKTVEDLAAKVEELKTAGVPLSDAVWEAGKVCIGWPYVYGAAGGLCTPSNRRARINPEHSSIVTACQVLNGSKSSCSGCKWYPGGKRVRQFDCRGYTKYLLELFGLKLNGGGCTSQWNDKSNWKEWGAIKDGIPDDILVCLFYSKNNKEVTWEHTGFGYHGETLECSKGVQYFPQRDRKWTHWAIPVGIDGEIPDIRPTIRKGNTGKYVELCQEDLKKLGYDIGKTGVDGKYGNATAAAVKQFQTDNGLKADGICGPLTWEALKKAAEDPEPKPERYTVTIPGTTKEQADRLCKEWSGATMKRE